MRWRTDSVNSKLFAQRIARHWSDCGERTWERGVPAPHNRNETPTAGHIRTCFLNPLRSWSLLLTRISG